MPRCRETAGKPVRPYLPLLALAALTSAFLAVLLVAAPFRAQAVTVTPDDQFAGISPVTPRQLEAELDSRNPNHIDPDIARLYVTWGYRFGIRADLAFAQMLHETNFLRYGGDVQPWQNNFAGIGAIGGGNPGNSFATPELGVIAQYAHLAWYVFPGDVNAYCNSRYDPRHFGPGHNNTGHTPRQLEGKWAVPGTGYGSAIARYANEIWRYPPSGKFLGSFNETQGIPATSLSTTFYFPWYDSKPANGMAGSWLLVGNEGSGDARVEVYIGGRKMHDPANPANDYFTIPAGGRITPQFTDVMGGPVRVVSTSGQQLLASERVLYHDSFNEVPGTPAARLSDAYEFTWYDSQQSHGMNGNWLLVSNQGSLPADVQIWIGPTLAATFSSAGGNALAPGAVVTPSFPGLMNGPVRVVSTNHQPLIASQRVLYSDSFSEVMGVPTATLDTQYFFSWYDNRREDSMKGDWILVANAGSRPAEVNVFVGDNLVASYSANTGNPIPPGGIVTPSFPQMMDGPVHVHCLNGQPLLASQRVLFRDSFEEVQGTPPAEIVADQWFSWYDSALADFMRGNWILVANRGSATASVEIYIGGVRMHDPANPANGYFTIPAGGRIAPEFPNTVGGPVHVISTNGQPLLTSQRVLYKDGLPQ
ncbi:MAG: glucosaminidase domain-containing protein [Thermoleophilia bacterium]